jgi:hypothetical protein
MKRKTNSIITKGAVLFLTLLPALAAAEDTGTVTGGGGVNVSIKLNNPLSKVNNIGDLVSKIIGVVVQVGGVAVVVAYIYVGFKFVMARGNEEEVTKAKKAFYWTVIGAAVLLGAEAINLGIQGTINQLGISPPS